MLAYLLNPLKSDQTTGWHWYAPSLTAYLLNPLKSDQTAKHLLSGIEEIYDRLEEDPWQFPACIDYVLRKKEYRKAKIPGMA